MAHQLDYTIANQDNYKNRLLHFQKVGFETNPETHHSYDDDVHLFAVENVVPSNIKD
ncbi:hypothetical protein D3C72_2304790 [compost metagenome]